MVLALAALEESRIKYEDVLFSAGALRLGHKKYINNLLSCGDEERSIELPGTEE